MSWRKSSSASANSSASGASQTSRADAALPAPYPFALALRVRVVQIVCGISGLVVGAVACLEQRGRLTLGLGVPAGAVTVLAAAASIYYSRGWGGYSGGSPAKSWGAPWRALGPTPRAAVPLAALWTAACALHVALLVLACDALFATTEEGLPSSSTTARGVACAQLALSITTLCAATVVARLDLRHDAS